LLVELGETVEELSIQESAPNAENATANGAASTQVKASVDSGIGIRGGKQYVMVSIFKKSQSRNKRVNRGQWSSSCWVFTLVLPITTTSSRGQ
jgi:hypothetical protein